MIGSRPWPDRPPRRKRSLVLELLLRPEVRVPWLPPAPPAGRVIHVIGEGS